MKDWFVILTLIGFIFLFIMGGIFVNVYAFDYFYTSDFVWDEAPIVCLNNPPPWKTYYGLQGATEWKQRLPPGFDYRVLVGYHEECNVNIETVDNIFDPMGNPLGRTNCEYDAQMFASGDEITFMNTTNWCYVEIRPDEDYGDTVKHEMGHVLGIGHRTIYNGTDVAKLVLTGDIMLPQQFGVLKITDYNLEALKLIYGEDGFEPPNIYNIITIKVIHNEDRDSD